MRGEWLLLPRSRRGGSVPKPGPWSARTIAAWNAWWRDPASSQWTQADRDAVRALAELLDDGLVKNAKEIRLRSDGLGLTQKGKRDLRWRVESDPVVEKLVAPADEFAGLSLVDDAVSA